MLGEGREETEETRAQPVGSTFLKNIGRQKHPIQFFHQLTREGFDGGGHSPQFLGINLRSIFT